MNIIIGDTVESKERDPSAVNRAVLEGICVSVDPFVVVTVDGSFIHDGCDINRFTRVSVRAERGYRYKAYAAYSKYLDTDIMIGEKVICKHPMRIFRDGDQEYDYLICESLTPFVLSSDDGRVICKNARIEDFLALTGDPISDMPQYVKELQQPYLDEAVDQLRKLAKVPALQELLAQALPYVSSVATMIEGSHKRVAEKLIENIRKEI